MSLRLFCLLFLSIAFSVKAQQPGAFWISCSESRNVDLQPHKSTRYKASISGSLGESDGQLKYEARYGGLNALNVTIEAIDNNGYWTTIQARLDNEYVAFSYQPSGGLGKIDIARFEFDNDKPYLVHTDSSLYQNCRASGI